MSTKNWGALLNDARSFISKDMELLSIIHSPKSVNDQHNQFVWYVSGSNEYTLKHLNRSDGNWSALLLEMRDWLNTYLAPH